MLKTTIYISEESKRALKRIAQELGRSESDLIRSAIDELIESQAYPRPEIPLFESGQPDLAERVDEALKGFGE